MRSYSGRSQCSIGIAQLRLTRLVGIRHPSPLENHQQTHTEQEITTAILLALQIELHPTTVGAVGRAKISKYLWFFHCTPICKGNNWEKNLLIFNRFKDRYRFNLTPKLGPVNLIQNCLQVSRKIILLIY
jgi:hypothetical protein